MRAVSEILTLNGNVPAKVKVKSKVNPLIELLTKEMHKYRRSVTMRNKQNYQ